jgi:hypothetical protein
MIDVLNKAFPEVKYASNKSDFYYEFPDTGSQIWVGGLDDKERTEKILGNEYATLFMNEASQFSFGGYELLKTRLNPPQGVPGKLLIDYNPPSMNHWGYQIFHKKINPESKQPIDNVDRYGSIKMNPGQNIDNLSPEYIKTLESMSESKKRRFLYGEYSDDSENALWKRAWIIENRWEKELPDLQKVVVGVDPAVSGTDTSDDTGIIIAGRAKIDGELHYFVLDDLTYHGDVTGWGKAVAKAYSDYMADSVVGEVNQGGDLVEMNIRNYDRNIKYTAVRATRGKAVRAEPVADLYRRGLVHHTKQLFDRDDQMCTWTEEAGDSPDNMDALVWAISYLAGLNNAHSGKVSFVFG